MTAHQTHGLCKCHTVLLETKTHLRVEQVGIQPSGVQSLGRFSARNGLAQKNSDCRFCLLCFHSRNKRFLAELTCLTLPRPRILQHPSAKVPLLRRMTGRPHLRKASFIMLSGVFILVLQSMIFSA